MKNKTKQKIVGLLLAGSISAGGGVLVGDTMVKEAQAEMLYEQVKSELFVKHLKGEAFEWNEFQLFTKILDREAKEGKFQKMGHQGKLINKMIGRAI